jgi:predicted nucleotidyltransferase component of viral defense system
MKETIFFKNANFVLEILPFLFDEKDFALKGGSAINYFYKNLPRLSIDIDLRFLPVKEREESLNEISDNLVGISDRLTADIQIKVFQKKLKDKVVKLLVNKNDSSVKIEPNLVIRGSVFPPEINKLVSNACELFEREMSFTCLSFADLYGGKICAALDRQHPRDLFDVKVLLEKDGFTENIKKAFIVYLISHPRPIVELLNPNFIDIAQVFENEFSGMTLQSIKLDDLLQTREQLVKLIKENLTEKERQFILSIKMGEPAWDLFDINHVKDLPAVKWKLANIEKMDRKKHKAAVEKLQEFFGL